MLKIEASWKRKKVHEYESLVKNSLHKSVSFVKKVDNATLRNISLFEPNLKKKKYEASTSFHKVIILFECKIKLSIIGYIFRDKYCPKFCLVYNLEFFFFLLFFSKKNEENCTYEFVWKTRIACKEKR